MKTYLSLLTLVVAVGAAMVARDGYATQEGSGASSAEVTSPQMATDMASAPVAPEVTSPQMATDMATAPATPAAEPTVDANGVALPGHEVKSDELKAIEASDCANQTRDAKGVVIKITRVACVGVDYTKKNPDGSDMRAMGSDRSDDAAYNPPKNLKINGQEISWAKYESFRQNGVELGKTDAEIQGAAARLQVESGFFSPNKNGANIVGDGGAAIGAAQWHSDRSSVLASYIDSQNAVRDAANGTTTAKTVVSTNGLKYTANDQANFVWKELPTQMSAANYAKFENATSANAAADAFTTYYERPATDTSQAYDKAGGNATNANATGFANAGSNAYIPDTSGKSTSLTQYASGNGNYTGSSGSGSTSSGNSASNLISSIFGNTGGLGTTLQQLMGGGSNASISQIVAALAIQKLTGGSTSTSEEKAAAAALAATNNGTTTTTTTTAAATVAATAASTTGSVVVTQSMLDLAKQCGGDLPVTDGTVQRAALMLVVKSCQVT